MMKKIYIYFLLALLAHFLLFLSFVAVITFSPPNLTANESLPAYIYQEEKNNPTQLSLATHIPQKELPISESGIEKPQPVKKAVQTKLERLSIGKGEQNINLNLKAKNDMDEPLLNLLTKATAAHLTYPKIAIDFRLRGTVVVGFILSPNGQISEMRLLRTSGNSVLDEEAMSAIQAAAPLKGADAYLTKPEPLEFGIIFG